MVEPWLQVRLDRLDLWEGGEASTVPSVAIIAATRCRLEERTSGCADEEAC